MEKVTNMATEGWESVKGGAATVYDSAANTINSMTNGNAAEDVKCSAKNTKLDAEKKYNDAKY